VFFWGEFLKRDDALNDPQYATIKKMYETATAGSPTTTTATTKPDSNASNAKSKKKAKTAASKKS
jgi:hypothetical protein